MSGTGTGAAEYRQKDIEFAEKIARLETSVGSLTQAVNDLREANTSQHEEIKGRLFDNPDSLEKRISDVEKLKGWRAGMIALGSATLTLVGAKWRAVLHALGF